MNKPYEIGEPEDLYCISYNIGKYCKPILETFIIENTGTYYIHGPKTIGPRFFLEKDTNIECILGYDFCNINIIK